MPTWPHRAAESPVQSHRRAQADRSCRPLQAPPRAPLSQETAIAVAASGTGHVTLTTRNTHTFSFKGIKLRAVTVDGEPWFVAADIASCLGLTQVSNSVLHLRDEEKGTKSIRTPGGRQNLVIISESGLYRLVMRSRKPVAREFQDWVVRDVLPAIRKDGGYVMGEEKVRTGRARHKDRPARDARTSWG